MADDLAVHDVTVKDVPSFTQQGSVAVKTQVTFYAGVHGPFVLTYDKAAATGVQIQSDIDKQVQMLRTIPGVSVTGAQR